MSKIAAPANPIVRLSTHQHLLLLIIITILPLLGLTLMDNLSSRDEARKISRNRAMEVLRMIQHRQDAVIDTGHHILATIGQLPDLVISGKDCDVRLAKITVNNKYISSVAVYKPDGQLVCATKDINESNISTKPYFQKALKTRKLATSDYTLELNPTRPSINILEPDFDSNGNIKFLILAAMDLYWLDEVITQLPLYDQSLLTIFNSEGVILFQYPNRTDKTTRKQFDNTLLIKNAIKDEHIGVIESTQETKEYINAYAPLSETNKVGGYIALSLPTEIALASSNEHLKNNLLILFFVTMIAITVATLWSRRYFIKPIKRLLNATTELKGGNFKTNLPQVRDSKELDELRAAFNNMATSLEHRQDEQQRLMDEVRLAATALETHEGMMILDSKRNILRINNAFTELTGYDKKDIIGSKPCMIFADPDRCDTCNRIWDQANQNMRWSGEVDIRQVNGQYFPTNTTVSVVEKEPSVISNYVVHIQDITDRKKAEAKISHLAYHDSLTDLPNRALLINRLHHTQANLKRRQEYGALIFIDLDHFKNINDSLGHVVGDGLLQQVADRLRNALRQEDTISRLGGDEFVILITQLGDDKQRSIHEAHRIATKILEIIGEIYFVDGHTLKVGASLGVAIFPDQEMTADDILRHADLAMYGAKNSGRNAIHFFEPEMQSRLIERLKIETELGNAFNRNEFVLFHQPQLNISDNRIIGNEVLLRWNHPERGIVAPGEFISILEDSGLIKSVGEWILSQACATLKDYSGRLLSIQPPMIAVNISPRQFMESNFVNCVISALRDHGIEGNMLELEITERTVMKDVEKTIQKMHALKDHGVRFSIDDFGTGYSSLAYIKRLPIDTLKIDRSFIRDCLDNSNDNAIVRAIVNMAKSLDFKIIAEGVETREQLAFLNSIGCNAYQGFHFSPAIPLDSFINLIQNHSPSLKKLS